VEGMAFPDYLSISSCLIGTHMFGPPTIRDVEGSKGVSPSTRSPSKNYFYIG
jgi:hypothetical protein